MGLTIFISYATKDKDIFHITELSSKLEKSSEIAEMLYWEEDAYGSITSYMEKNVRKCDVFLLFCSPNAKKSKWVKLEWEAAINENKSIIPIFLDIKHVPSLLKSFRGLKFDQFNVESTFQQLHDLIINTANKGSLISDLPTPSGSTGSSSPISISQKEFNYYKTLGNDALNKLNHDEALEMFKKALETAEKSLDLKLTKEAKSLINNLKHQKKKFEAKQKLEKGLVPKAEKAMQANNWQHAIEIWKEIKEIASTNSWSDIIQNATENINESKQKQMRFEKRKNIETELIPEAEHAMSANNWQHATNIWQQIKDIAKDYGFSDIKQRALEQYNECEQKSNIFQQKEIIENLEVSIGKSLPEVKRINYDTLGVKYDGNKLIGLGLYACGLTTLPDSFSQLKNLQYLILRNNRLTTLPDSFGDLKSLQKLWLYDNKLTTLP
ncbi:MAG: TIR domain-containing protein, partial [Promethearchaeota archaeon]